MGWILSYVFGYCSDYLLRSGKVSVGTSRKIFNSIAHYGPALGLVWLAWVGCDRTQAILALCISVGLNAGVYTGYQVPRNPDSWGNFIKFDKNATLDRSTTLTCRPTTPAP